MTTHTAARDQLRAAATEVASVGRMPYVVAQSTDPVIRTQQRRACLTRLAPAIENLAKAYSRAQALGILSAEDQRAFRDIAEKFGELAKTYETTVNSAPAPAPRHHRRQHSGRITRAEVDADLRELTSVPWWRRS
jgi:hypothetical protein